ncbi:MAG: peroxiredoxin [Candidatus Limnocylindrales bacterium]
MSDTTSTRPAVGELAPDFTLPDDTGAERTLSAERGRWLVLYFYPKDDTPGCTTESCQFRDAYEEYQQTGAEVWGISILGSGSKAAFKAKFGLPFTLIADEDHQVAEAYGVWVEKQNYGKTYKGIERATFLVDPVGRVAKAWSKVDPDGHADEVLEAIRSLAA